jgi:hypothetical protein
MEPHIGYTPQFGPVGAGRPRAPQPPPTPYRMHCLYCGAGFPTPQMLQAHLASPVHTLDVWADVQVWCRRRRRPSNWSVWGPRPHARHLQTTQREPAYAPPQTPAIPVTLSPRPPKAIEPPAQKASPPVDLEGEEVAVSKEEEENLLCHRRD